MLRSVKHSDDDAELKTGRNTRLKTRTMLDSPLRRSNRLRQPSKLLAESSVNQFTRITRKRSENIDTDDEMSKGRNIRGSSVPLDKPESIDNVIGTPKRSTRRDTTVTPTRANTRAASKRMVRAISETNSPMRTTRRTRTNSVNSTIQLDPNEDKSHPKTRVNTRKRTTALPSASPVSEEIEDIYGLFDMEADIVLNEDNESVTSANSDTSINIALLSQQNPELNKKRRNLFKGKFKLHSNDDEMSIISSSTETVISKHTQDQKDNLVAEQRSVFPEAQLSDNVTCAASSFIVSPSTCSTRKTIKIKESPVEVKQSESENSLERELAFEAEHLLNSSVEEKNKNPSDKENQTMNIIKDIKQSVNPVISNVFSLNSKSSMSPFTNKSLSEEETKPVSNASSLSKRRHSKESIEARTKRHSLSKEVTDIAKEKTDISLNTNMEKDISGSLINVKSSKLVSPQNANTESVNESVENVMATINKSSKMNETESDIIDIKITNKIILNKTDILYSPTDQSITRKNNYEEENQSFISNINDDEIKLVGNRKLEKLNIHPDEKEVPHNSENLVNLSNYAETSSEVNKTFSDVQAVILDQHLINKSSVQDDEVDNLSNSIEQTKNLNKCVVKSRTGSSDVDFEMILSDNNASSDLIEILDKSSEKPRSKNISLKTTPVSKRKIIDKGSLIVNKKKSDLKKNPENEERKGLNSDSDISLKYLFQDVSVAKCDEMNEEKKKSGLKKDQVNEETESSSSDSNISFQYLFQDVSVAKYDEMNEEKKKSGLKKDQANEERKSCSSDSDISFEYLLQDVPVAKYNEMNEEKKKSGLKHLENEERKSRDENNLVHSTLIKKPKNKDECDLILMNKKAWLTAEHMKIAQKEEPFEYDSDDTVLLKSQLDALQAHNSMKELVDINEELEMEIDSEDDMQVWSLTKRKSMSKKIDSSTGHEENMNYVSLSDDPLHKSKHVLNQSNRSSSRLNKSEQAIRETEQSLRIHSESEEEIEDDMEQLHENSQLSKKDISLQKSTKKRTPLNKSVKKTPSNHNDLNVQNISTDKSGKNLKKLDEEVDNSESDSDMCLSLSSKNLKTKYDQLKSNYSTIAQAGSDSDVLGSSNTSDNEDDDDGNDDHDNDSIDSDIAKEYNLKGVERQFSDDDVLGDDCRASESEYSDSEDSGTDLEDFIVYNNEVEYEEDEEDEDKEEEWENEKSSRKSVEKEIENEQEDMETINKDDVNKEEDTDETESSDAETDASIEHVIAKLPKKHENKMKDVKTKKYPLKRTEETILLDTSKSSSSSKKKINSDLSPKELLEQNAMKELYDSQMIFTKHLSKLHTAIDCSTPKSASNRDKFKINPETSKVVLDEEDKNKLSNTDERIENSSLKKQESNIKSKQNYKEKTLHTSLPFVLLEATRKEPLFSEKAELCKTMNITHTETPTIRHLMKEKLNESAPTLKLNEQVNLMKKIQSPAEEKNNPAQTTDNDKEATNLIKLSNNDLIQECKRQKHKKHMKQTEKIMKENISNENLSPDQIESDISTKTKSADSNQLSVVENTCQSTEKNKSKRKKKKNKKNQIKEENIKEKKKEEKQKKDKKKKKGEENKEKKEDSEEKIMKENISNENLSPDQIESDISTKMKSVDSNQLSVVENTCQSTEKNKRKKEKKKKKKNQNKEENIKEKKEEEKQKKDKKKKKGEENKEKKEDSEEKKETVQKKKQKEEKKQIDIPKININQNKKSITENDEIGQHNMKKKRKIGSPEYDCLPTENFMSLNKKVKQLEVMENEENSLKPPKKKKKKEKISLEANPTLQLESSEISKNVAFVKARDEALAALTRVTENIRTNKEIKKTNQQNSKQDMNQKRFNIPIKQQKHTAGESNEIPPSTSGLKRLSDDIIENLSDILIVKKKRKLQQNEQIMPPLASNNPNIVKSKLVKKKRKDIISLSTSGSTTQFAIVNMEKIEKQSRKTVTSFRERMLSRNPRLSTSSYLMYLQKQQMTTNNN